MPEGLEAEIWRSAIERLVGRRITHVVVDERVADPDLVSVLTGRVVTGARRRGKVVVVDTDGPGLGLHFGMTGRVVVDGRSPIQRLEYSSGADRPEWDRLLLWTDPSGTADPLVPALRMNDPRRLGRLSIDPDTALDRLGPEAFTLKAAELRSRLAGRRSAIKTLLLDQTVVAGLGNLCADEVLFWAGLAPTRPADSLRPDDVARLARASRERCRIMLRRGGSTHGDLDPEIRREPGRCPKDGARLRRDSIAGRTAVWCPQHQR